MDKQELFNTVWNGLKSQGFSQSLKIDTFKTSRLDDDGNVVEYTAEKPLCMYRSPNGNRCAAGWVLPDEAYNADDEGSAVGGVTWFLNNFDSETIDFLRACQSAHDGVSWADGDTGRYIVYGEDEPYKLTPEAMQVRLRKIAEHFNLTIPGE
jgi:hypothetical protein